MEPYDVIIVGAGPAGLTAGIYAARRKLRTLILSKDVGGQARLATSVRNYPGFTNTTGAKLIRRFEKQVRKFGVEIAYEEVKAVEEKNGSFLVKTERREIEGRSIILAFGKTPRSLNVDGEKEFVGKGISYCGICDLPLFKDKTIAVVGGGNTALDTALEGSKIAKKVYLIHRREEFRGFEELVDEVKKKKNVELLLNSVVERFEGNEFLRAAVIRNVKSGEVRRLEIDGAFIQIGFEARTDWLKGFVKLDEYGQIVINERCETFYPSSNEIRPGVFAAGDVSSVPFKQIVVAAGEGCKAALQAWNYLHGIKAPFVVEWGKK